MCCCDKMPDKSLERRRVCLGCSFRSLVPHGGKKQREERRGEGERRELAGCACWLSLSPVIPPGVPACTGVLSPYSVLWNHAQGRSPASLPPSTRTTNACTTAPRSLTWTLRLKLRFLGFCRRSFTNSAISSSPWLLKMHVCACVFVQVYVLVPATAHMWRSEELVFILVGFVCVCCTVCSGLVGL